MILLSVGLCALLSIHMTDPWQYLHDDNGAWFTSIARTHLARGLGETKGQDFFLARDGNELKPYLHHPPFIGLYLAGFFQLTQASTPFCARLAVGVLHVLSFFVFILIARWFFGKASLATFWAIFVYACVPMSVFFGKMPNHEVPGLLFLLIGIYASLRATAGPAPDGGWLAASLVSWLLVCFTSWHAALCALIFVILVSTTRESRGRRVYLPASCAVIFLGLLLVGLQILWANHWALHPSQSQSLTHWFSTSADKSWARDYFGNLGHAATHGRRFFAVIPWALCIVWITGVSARALRRDKVADPEILTVALGLGSLLYCICFARAVRIHAYQQFYLLPFVAVSSAWVVSEMHARFSQGGRVRAALFVLVLAVLTVGFSARRLSRIYGKPDAYAVKTTREITEQFK